MNLPLSLIIYALTGLNVFLAARIWANSDQTPQKRYALFSTAVAIALSAYVVAFEGDGDLTPLGAIAAGFSTLAVGMWVRAWW